MHLHFMIELDSVTFTYPHRLPIFQNFNLTIERGDALAVLGPSGGGKTTLLYLLAGLRQPTSGQVRIEGEPLSRPRPRTGLILQDYGLLPWATLRENARLGLKVRRFYGPDGKHAPPAAQVVDRVDYWLERLGLADISRQYPTQVSGGQRQRAAIARTLALTPDLLLMDEPFSSLDAPTRESLQNLTVELQAEQALTLVLVTHLIEEAAAVGRKILLLKSSTNQEADIITNRHAGEPGYRTTTEYVDLVRELRRRMEMQG